MKIRRIVSLIALLSFCVMAGTGVVMFLAQQSRVAYWNGWELFGLSKRDYDAIHSTFMLLFLTSIVWHTVLNWKFLVDYLKTSTRTILGRDGLAVYSVRSISRYRGSRQDLLEGDSWLSTFGSSRCDTVGSVLPWNGGRG
jgi:hypothetical protein